MSAELKHAACIDGPFFGCVMSVPADMKKRMLMFVAASYRYDADRAVLIFEGFASLTQEERVKLGIAQAPWIDPPVMDIGR